MWIVGADFYGKVDRIPGICHVRTRFLHVMFFPFVPTGSYLIHEWTAKRTSAAAPSISASDNFLIAEGEAAAQGAPTFRIGLSLKSIAFGWWRALLVVAILVCWSGALEAVFEPKRRANDKDVAIAWEMAGFGFVMCGVYALTIPLGKPRSRRREWLMRLVAEQIPPDLVEELGDNNFASSAGNSESAEERA